MRVDRVAGIMVGSWNNRRKSGVLHYQNMRISQKSHVHITCMISSTYEYCLTLDKSLHMSVSPLTLAHEIRTLQQWKIYTHLGTLRNEQVLFIR